MNNNVVSVPVKDFFGDHVNFVNSSGETVARVEVVQGHSEYNKEVYTIRVTTKSDHEESKLAIRNWDGSDLNFEAHVNGNYSELSFKLS